MESFIQIEIIMYIGFVNLNTNETSNIKISNKIEITVVFNFCVDLS